MKHYAYFLLSLLLFSCRPAENDKLHIAAAANMKFALDEIIKAFEAEKKIECEVVYSSSGKLSAQIIEGAAYDLFLSANMEYPQRLYDLGLCYDKPEVYALGSLVLWTKKQSLFQLEEIDLRDPQIRKIAMPNPKTAPYGIAAQDYLVNTGVYEALEDKLVYGESVQQSNHFISSKSVEIGFTAASTAYALQDKHSKFYTLNEDHYWPVKQGFVVIKNKRNKKLETVAFADYLKSEKAQEILRKFAYQIPNR